jgi:hypothetical protein
MRDIFEDIKKDLRELENSLAFQVPYFRYDGNVYLVSNNLLKNKFLRQQYIKDCKLNLNFSDRQNLPPIVKSYRSLLALLALKMERDLEAEPLKSALDNSSSWYQGEDLIVKLSLVKSQMQYLLTILNGYLIGEYSFKSVPPNYTQDFLESDLDGFKFDTDEVDISIDLTGLKTNGIPDMEKIKQREKEDNSIKLKISTETEVLEKILLIEEYYPDIKDMGVLRGLIVSALTSTFNDIYNFLYEQIFTVNISVKEAIVNLKQKVPDAKMLFKTRLIKSYKELINENDYKQILPSEEYVSEFLDFIEVEIPKEIFFRYAEPRIYKINFREPSSLEKKLYNPIFSIDMNIHEEFTANVEVDLSTFCLGFSSKVYELSSMLICTRNFNKNWQQEKLFDREVKGLERVGLDLDLQIDRINSQANNDRLIDDLNKINGG